MPNNFKSIRMHAIQKCLVLIIQHRIVYRHHASQCSFYTNQLLTHIYNTFSSYQEVDNHTGFTTVKSAYTVDNNNQRVLTMFSKTASGTARFGITRHYLLQAYHARRV